MKKGIYLLPNGITLCGMFAGFFAIISALNGEFILASWAIVVAGVFDGLDGAVARLTNTSSSFGVQMDSLSDVISFGVAPAVMLYTWALMPFGRVGWAVAFLFTACGAMRLARFNVQKASTEKLYFTGMPIPAAAGVVASNVLFFDLMGWKSEGSFYALMLTIVLAVLMVSTMRFHSVKELGLKRRKPFMVLVFLVVVLSIISMYPEWSLFLIGMAYISLGVVENVYLVLRARRKAAPAG